MTEQWYVALVLLSPPQGGYVFPGHPIDMSFRAPEQIEQALKAGIIAPMSADMADTGSPVEGQASIFGDMPTYVAQALIDAGVGSLAQFARMTPMQLAQRLSMVSYQQIEAWQAQARAFLAAPRPGAAAPATLSPIVTTPAAAGETGLRQKQADQMVKEE